MIDNMYLLAYLANQWLSMEKFGKKVINTLKDVQRLETSQTLEKIGGVQIRLI